MTREEIMALTGRDLDGEIAEKLFCCEGLTSGHGGSKAAYPLPPTRELSPVPHFSTDANALRDMEQEIDRQYLATAYVKRLTEIVFPTQYESYRQRGILPGFYDCTPSEVFYMRSASLEDCCRAALIVVTGSGEN